MALTPEVASESEVDPPKATDALPPVKPVPAVTPIVELVKALLGILEKVLVEPDKDRPVVVPSTAIVNTSALPAAF